MPHLYQLKLTILTLVDIFYFVNLKTKGGASMKTIDMAKRLKTLYTAGRQLEEIVGERGVFLCVDGSGDPLGEASDAAIKQLHTMVRTIGRLLKEAGRMDFKSSRLEFRWMSDPRKTPKEEWGWRFMIRVPDEVTQADLKKARKVLRNRGRLSKWTVKRVCWREGRALQVMHIGPDEATADVYDKLGEKADEFGYRVRGPGHEIFISNRKNTDPGKRKKIVRLPISRPRPDYARGRPTRQSQ
jgi:hypothetical protein